MISAIKKRRSVREYLVENISEDKLNEVLAAAMYAPSAQAVYPWELIVVKDQHTKETLSKTTPWSFHANEAPVVVVVVGHEEDSQNWVEDCSIVATHIWLEAVEQGLSSCWIQIRGNDNAEKEIKTILGIPAERRVLCLMPLGVAANNPPEHTVDDFDKSKIRQERY